MRTGSTADTPRGAFATCWDLLPHVSRTFALTIPVLSEPLRDHVAVAYLLCRVADTVEDAEDILPGRRRELFGCLLELLNRPLDPQERGRLLQLWCGRVDPHHERLIRKSGDVLLAFASLPESARSPVRSCLQEMIAGMAFTPEPRAGEVVEICPDLPALEEYCHRVAGTVGILLSRLFDQEIRGAWLTPERLEQGRRFGLGLQLTNVLKDEIGDRRRGVSYIPAEFRDADRPGTPISRDGVRVLVERAIEHLDEAEAYILSLPSRRTDMRLFCILASHLALATLSLVARHPGQAVKVSRGQVEEITAAAHAAVRSDTALGGLHRELRSRVIDGFAAA